MPPYLSYANSTAISANYFSLRQAMPGKTLPSKSSNDAPPPVEMWLILSANPS